MVLIVNVGTLTPAKAGMKNTFLFFETAGCFGTVQPGSLGDSYIVDNKFNKHAFYTLLIGRKCS